MGCGCAGTGEPILPTRGSGTAAVTDANVYGRVRSGKGAFTVLAGGPDALRGGDFEYKSAERGAIRPRTLSGLSVHVVAANPCGKLPGVTPWLSRPPLMGEPSVFIWDAVRAEWAAAHEAVIPDPVRIALADLDVRRLPWGRPLEPLHAEWGPWAQRVNARARLAGAEGRISPCGLANIVAAADGRCVYCGGPGWDDIEHWRALSRGGSGWW